MDKFHGEVGYALTVEDPIGSGIWVDQIIERLYFGDVERNVRRLEENTDKQNDDIEVSSSISMVVDEYAYEHIFQMRYVKWAGVLWKVTSVEVQRPRLLLTLGDIYNGPTPEG